MSKLPSTRITFHRFEFQKPADPVAPKWWEIPKAKDSMSEEELKTHYEKRGQIRRHQLRRLPISLDTKISTGQGRSKSPASLTTGQADDERAEKSESAASAESIQTCPAEPDTQWDPLNYLVLQGDDELWNKALAAHDAPLVIPSVTSGTRTAERRRASIPAEHPNALGAARADAAASDTSAATPNGGDTSNAGAVPDNSSTESGSAGGTGWTFDPVVELDPGQNQTVVECFNRLLNEYNSTLLDTGGIENVTSDFAWKALWQQFERRMENTLDVVHLARGDFDLGAKTILTYPLRRRETHYPVGFLVMHREEGHGYIDAFATHAGSQFAGLPLTEGAVNKSADWGYGGRLQLESLNPDSDSFYERLGFERRQVAVDGGHRVYMSFDPGSDTNQQKWEFVEQRWRLKSDERKPYQFISEIAPASDTEDSSRTPPSEG